MNKETVGRYTSFGGYGFLLGAAIVAAKHPLIIVLLILGAAAIFFGRVLQKA